MTKRDEQLGLEHFLVTKLGEKNRLRIRMVIEENTPKLEGTPSKEWKLSFSRRVLAALNENFQASTGTEQNKESSSSPEISEESSSPGNSEPRIAYDHVQIEGDVGPQLLAFIYEQMQIDPEWSLREKRNLTWWGHRFAQRIWAETVIMEDGDEIVRVHAETDVLRN